MGGEGGGEVIQVQIASAITRSSRGEKGARQRQKEGGEERSQEVCVQRIQELYKGVNEIEGLRSVWVAVGGKK